MIAPFEAAEALVAELDRTGLAVQRPHHPGIGRADAAPHRDRPGSRSVRLLLTAQPTQGAKYGAT